MHPTVTFSSRTSFLEPDDDVIDEFIVEEPLSRESLDRDSPSTQRLLGFLHAVSVAPGFIPTTDWLPKALEITAQRVLSEEEAGEAAGIVLCTYVLVLNELRNRAPITPEPSNVEVCVAFAAGFIQGAELDPEWLGNEQHWALATPLAYLAGRRDLVPSDTLARWDTEPKLELDTRQRLADTVNAAQKAFSKVRSAEVGGIHFSNATVQSAPRTGRNAPCPCGSRRRFKRCCGAG